MYPISSEFQELFDAKGQCLGAILGPEAWLTVRDLVLARFAPAQVAAPEVVEPLQDWHDLVQFWDFKYPVDLDVKCSLCGNETLDWQQDEPRKFRLTAANLGGLVTFRCLGCQAKVMKRHFKDSIKVEAKPFLPEKSARNLGRPG
ncbi:MAG: hypothetical protein P4L39_01170 [Humidesulfovibrio sp.]|nr:hypothetical protein [Humidesulfovibrio sp.]